MRIFCCENCKIEISFFLFNSSCKERNYLKKRNTIFDRQSKQIIGLVDVHYFFMFTLDSIRGSVVRIISITVMYKLFIRHWLNFQYLHSDNIS